MSDKATNSLIETINQIIDKNDPTQKAISLLAVLIDTQLKFISSENSEQHTDLGDKIENIVKTQAEHEKRISEMENKKLCPLGIDTKHEQMKKDLQVVLFFSEYPKLSILVLLGILALCGLGVDKLVDIAGSMSATLGK